MSDDKIEFYTVVYRVVGGKARHDEWWQSVHSRFMVEGPISITTMAVGDLAAKLDDLEEQLAVVAGDC